MSKVRVNKEGLQIVSQTLGRFEKEMSSLSFESRKQCQEIERYCHQTIENVIQQIQGIEGKMKEIKHKINYLQGQIQKLLSQKEHAEIQLKDAQGQVAWWQGEVNSLQNQLAAAYADMNTDDEVQKNRAIQRRNQLEGELIIAQSKVNAYQSQASSAAGEVDRCQQEIQHVKTEVEGWRRELQALAVRCERLEQKKRNLQLTYEGIRVSLQSYLKEALFFQESATQISSKGRKGVRACMQAVEEYISTMITGV